MRGGLQKPSTVTLLVRSHFSKLGDPGATCTSAVLNRDATISSRAVHHGTQTMHLSGCPKRFLLRPSSSITTLATNHSYHFLYLASAGPVVICV